MASAERVGFVQVSRTTRRRSEGGAQLSQGGEVSESKSSGGSSGIGLAGLLGVLFIGLKLAGIGAVAKWSWLWVLSPFWISLLLAILALAIGGFLIWLQLR
jgi:hypothetical protein